MYYVEANNCDTVRIEVKFPHLNEGQANGAFCVLVQAFRDVRIISEETGEVMRTAYWADEFFDKDIAEEKAIAIVREYLTEY